MKGLSLQLEDDVHRALKAKAASLGVTVKGLAVSILTSKLTGKKVIPEGSVKVAPTMEEKLVARIKASPDKVALKRDLQRSLNIDAYTLNQLAKKLGLIEVSPFRGKMQSYVLPSENTKLPATIALEEQDRIMKVLLGKLSTAFVTSERTLIALAMEQGLDNSQSEQLIKHLDLLGFIEYRDPGMDYSQWGYVKKVTP